MGAVLALVACDSEPLPTSQTIGLKKTMPWTGLMPANNRLRMPTSEQKGLKRKSVNFKRKISRGLKKDWPPPHKSSQRLLTLPTNQNVCARCSRTEACQMKRGWKPSKTNLRKPDSWLKKPTENTTRLPES